MLVTWDFIDRVEFLLVNNMSMASGAESAAPVSHHSKSFFAQILGVLHSPRATFHDVARAPRWISTLTFTFLLSTGVSAVVLETEVGHIALLDRWDRTATAFGQNIDEGRYATMETATEHGSLFAVAGSFTGGPLLVVALSGLLFGAFRSGSEGVVTYGQVLAVVTHAGVILTLRQVVAAPLVYTREMLGSPLTLQLFFSSLDETSFLARFSGAIDLFVVWWIVVLAIGMSVLYRRRARRLAVRFLGVYVTLAAALAFAISLAGGAS